MTVNTPTRARELQDIIDTDDGRNNNVGSGDWYTLKCVCHGNYAVVVGTRLIVVWPSEDDPNMLRIAADHNGDADCVGAVVPYEKSMGKCISYYDYVKS